MRLMREILEREARKLEARAPADIEAKVRLRELRKEMRAALDLPGMASPIRKPRILDVAADVLAENGNQPMTAREIAEAAYARGFRLPRAHRQGIEDYLDAMAIIFSRLLVREGGPFRRDIRPNVGIRGKPYEFWLGSPGSPGGKKAKAKADESGEAK